MKRTLSVLVSLAAIALLSCSFLDNSNSSAEGTDYPQALQKAIPSDEATLSSSSVTYSASSLGVTMNVGVTATGPELEFLLPGTLPRDAIITGIVVNTGTLATSIGLVTSNYLKIRKGSDYTEIPWSGADGTTLPTNYFNGKPARDTYYLSHKGTCSSGITYSFCSKVYKNVKLTISYYTP
ncbi:MAG: hypothetical protein LBH25_12870 [Fibromonadaceae bacterium]|jgi:hypothetical protein|nr:hypothetical protein [Fibromonadaceae bacterium]